MSANATADIGAIRERRRARGISQQALAERARCSVSMMRLLESGYVPGTSAVLDRIEAVLNDAPAAPGPGAADGIRP